MQAGNLKDNIAAAVEGQNAMLSKSAQKWVLVYVEGLEDIPFWRNALHPYENAHLKFDIKTPTHKGKSKILERHQDFSAIAAGPYLIHCVDSDYDYLLPEHSDQARKINSDPFIFQTYSYSVENLRCFSDSLRQVATHATKHDGEPVDFNAFLHEYSLIVYRLFLWSLHFRSIADHATFTLSDFSRIAKIENVTTDDNCTAALNALINRVTTKVRELESNHINSIADIDNLAREISAKGATAENTYLFIHGHTLKDGVVVPVLKAVYDVLTRQKYDEIEKDAKHPTQKIFDRQHYSNQKQKVEDVLDANTEYKACFLYQRIQADLDNYIKNFNLSQ